MRLNGWSLRDLAAKVRAAGAKYVKHQHIQQLVANPKRQPKYLLELAKAAGMTAEQWMSWHPDDEPPTASTAMTAAYPPDGVLPAEIPDGYVRFRLHDFAVSAGPGAGGSDYPEVVRMLDLAEWWCRERGIPRPYDRVRVLTCRGDSMRGDIEDGDLLFVDAQRAHYDGPGIYVLNWQGHALVKRLAPQMDGRMAILSSNPAYPPELVTKGELDALHIGGRVVTSLTARRW
jgi:phage repressor protein C with HTH and peptisase S24 domain